MNHISFTEKRKRVESQGSTGDREKNEITGRGASESRGVRKHGWKQRRLGSNQPAAQDPSSRAGELESKRGASPSIRPVRRIKVFWVEVFGDDSCWSEVVFVFYLCSTCFRSSNHNRVNAEQQQISKPDQPPHHKYDSPFPPPLRPSLIFLLFPTTQSSSHSLISSSLISPTQQPNSQITLF